MRNLIILILFSFFFLLDIVTNLNAGIPLPHIFHEVILLIIGAGAIAWQLKVIWKKNQHISELSAELLDTKKEYQDWKDRSFTSATHIRQLIDQQFGLWHLSHSEKEVALLLIKGFSMKEIADFRNTHEKTVRQQATSIYKKSNLSGRQELAAFFLEDILSAP